MAVVTLGRQHNQFEAMEALENCGASALSLAEARISFESRRGSATPT